MAGGPIGATARHLARLFGSGTVAGLSEGQLLHRFAAGGDPSAFEALVERHGPMVLGVCRRVLADPNDADDAFQATFLVLARRAHALAGRDRLAGWLHGVARKVAVRARADAARRRDREGILALDPAARGDAQADPARRDLAAAVHEEIGRLPAHYREPVLLCDLSGLTHEEAARRLGCPVGTVKGRQARARALLKRRLTRRGLAPASAALAVAGLARGASAAVPAALRIRTIEAAAIAAAGRAAGGIGLGLASAHVAALSEGVLSTMILAKWKISGTALLATGLVAGGAGALAQRSGLARPAVLVAESGPGRPEADPPAPPPDIEAGPPAEAGAASPALPLSGEPSATDPVVESIAAKLGALMANNPRIRELREGVILRQLEFEKARRAARNPGDPAVVHAKRQHDEALRELEQFRWTLAAEVQARLAAMEPVMRADAPAAPPASQPPSIESAPPPPPSPTPGNPGPAPDTAAPPREAQIIYLLRKMFESRADVARLTRALERARLDAEADAGKADGSDPAVAGRRWALDRLEKVRDEWWTKFVMETMAGAAQLPDGPASPDGPVDAPGSEVGAKAEAFIQDWLAGLGREFERSLRQLESGTGTVSPVVGASKSWAEAAQAVATDDEGRRRALRDNLGRLRAIEPNIRERVERGEAPPSDVEALDLALSEAEARLRLAGRDATQAPGPGEVAPDSPPVMPEGVPMDDFGGMGVLAEPGVGALGVPTVGSDRRSREAARRLERPATFAFPNDTPLEDVLRFLKTATADEGGASRGIPVYVDPLALQEAERTLTSPVQIDLEGVPIRTGLTLALHQLGLTYAIRDGVLIITALPSPNGITRPRLIDLLPAEAPDED